MQHIALRTNDIIKSVENLRARGLEFIKTPSSYYINLKEQLKTSKVKINEDLDIVIFVLKKKLVPLKI